MVFNIVSLGSWVDYGVDFTGGTLVQVRFDERVTAADLRAALGGAQAPSSRAFGAENEFTIRAPLPEDTENLDVVSQPSAAGSTPPASEPTKWCGPRWWDRRSEEELTRQAGLAILFSFLLTLLYIAFRFEFRFGLAAIVATVHDILITLGFLALFRVEISLPTVAADPHHRGVLAERHDRRVRPHSREPEQEGRTPGGPGVPHRPLHQRGAPPDRAHLMTTLAVLVALLILGGAVIRDFTIVLILGVVMGTYSSIFVASPALIEIQDRWQKDDQGKKKKRKKGASAPGDPTAIPV
jgi:preprotein translocase subunit SecF